MSIGSNGITPFFKLPNLNELGRTFEVVTPGTLSAEEILYQRAIPDPNLFWQFTAYIVGINANSGIRISFKRTATVYRSQTTVDVISQVNDYDFVSGTDINNVSALFEGTISDDKINLKVGTSGLGVPVSWRAFIQAIPVDRSKA